MEPSIFIKRMAERLRSFPEINPPKELKFWKTAAGKEFPPEDSDGFWYIRSASLLRKLALKKNIGVNRLRNEYSVVDRRGHKPRRFSKSAGGIIRRCLQQLQKAGLVGIEEKVGRKLTPAGQSLIDKVAHDILRETARP